MLTTSVVRVFGMEETLVAAGLPYVREYNARSFEDATLVAEGDEHIIERAGTLAGNAPGEAHHCFLEGIIVQMNITAPLYWWPEFQRYHFADIVSATSTMHCLKKNIKTMQLSPERIYDFFTEETTESVIRAFLDAASKYPLDEQNIARLKAMLPCGYLQTARITTNYRQLKTMYAQRHDHPLQEWKTFCKSLLDLPHSDWITAGS